MKRTQETEEDFSPEFTARWRAEGNALYLEKLKELAAEAGLMKCPEMLQKIRDAEKAAAAAAENLERVKAAARQKPDSLRAPARARDQTGRNRPERKNNENLL